MRDFKDFRVLFNKQVTDPCINLATEEYLVRKAERGSAWIFLYVNDPCVVVGKHQNIAEEVNTRYCLQQRIAIVRRLSGGGTVYQDHGNLNISFVSDHDLRDVNNYDRFLQPVLSVIRGMGIEVRTNERNNILIGDKKISGNAQFTSRRRMISHGTLLINADLEHLQKTLGVRTPGRIESKATQSVRSAVTNLNDHLQEAVNSIQFAGLLIDAFIRRGARRSDLDENAGMEIHRSTAKYRSWEWTYGNAPRFKINVVKEILTKIVSLELEIEHGKIIHADIESDGLTGRQRSALEKIFAGQRFELSALNTVNRRIGQNRLLHELAGFDWTYLFF